VIATRDRTFELHVPLNSARAASRKALRDRGWGVSEEGDRALVGIEDMAKICCIDSPIRLKIELSPTSETVTEVRIEGSMTGWGLVQAKKLSEHPSALERQIRRNSAAVATPPTEPIGSRHRVR